MPHVSIDPARAARNTRSNWPIFAGLIVLSISVLAAGWMIGNRMPRFLPTDGHYAVDATTGVKYFIGTGGIGPLPGGYSPPQ